MILATINPIWITFGPVLVINTILGTSYFLFQFGGKKHLKRDYAGAKTGGSKMLGSVTREWWFWTTNPIVIFLLRSDLRQI